jgi:hypothetical protein
VYSFFFFFFLFFSFFSSSSFFFFFFFFFFFLGGARWPCFCCCCCYAAMLACSHACSLYLFIIFSKSVDQFYLSKITNTTKTLLALLIAQRILSRFCLSRKFSHRLLNMNLIKKKSSFILYCNSLIAT